MGEKKLDEEVTKDVGTNYSTNEFRAKYSVNKYMLWSMGVGIIPIPMVDIVGIAAIQLKMVSDLSRIYGVEFSENRGKAFISSLVGSLGAEGLARSAFSITARFIPFVGPLMAAVAMPAFAGASTYAIGRVFVQHFESGGTFLNFEPSQVKDYFAEQFQQGKLIVMKEHRK